MGVEVVVAGALYDDDGFVLGFAGLGDSSSSLLRPANYCLLLGGLAIASTVLVSSSAGGADSSTFASIS